MNFRGWHDQISMQTDAQLE